MTKHFLLPGGLICDAVGLTEGSDNSQILRILLNTLIWGAAGVITILVGERASRRSTSTNDCSIDVFDPSVGEVMMDRN
jgi:hypothetical protein